MPSGHSQSAWFFYSFGMLYLFDKIGKNQEYSSWVIITLLLMTAIAIFISYSRVYKNYHTTQQVILGGIIGFGMGVAGYILTKYIIDGTLSIKTLRKMIKIV